MFVALVLLCLGLWAANHDFLGASNVINTTRQVSMLGVFAIGISFVIITGGIDLSIGSVIGLTGVLIAKLSGQYYPDSPAAGGLGYSLWLGIPVALAVAALVGLAQGLLITRLNLQPFIVTLGGMLLLRGVSQTVVRGGTLSLGDVPLARLANGGLLGSEGSPLLPYPLLILLVVAALGAYLLHFTVFGRYVYAIGGNRDAAIRAGIPVRRRLLAVYALSSVLASLAGLTYALRYVSGKADAGASSLLDSIAAVMIGGASMFGGSGTVGRTLAGCLVIAVLELGLRMRGTPTFDKYILVGVILVAAVVVERFLPQDRK
jgi:ribose transport system permease protein